MQQEYSIKMKNIYRSRKIKWELVKDINRVPKWQVMIDCVRNNNDRLCKKVVKRELKLFTDTIRRFGFWTYCDDAKFKTFIKKITVQFHLKKHQNRTQMECRKLNFRKHHRQKNEWKIPIQDKIPPSHSLQGNPQQTISALGRSQRLVYTNKYRKDHKALTFRDMGNELTTASQCNHKKKPDLLFMKKF